MIPSIISFSGQKNNGKDTAADYLANILNEKYCCGREFGFKDTGLFWYRTAFAEPVKDVLCNSLGIDRQFIEDWKRVHEPPPGFDKSIREALTFLGDGMRQIKKNVWIKRLFEEYDKKNVIISDARYYNEINFVKKHNGICFLVYRPNFENNEDHPSENEIKTEIDKTIFNYNETGPVKDSIFDFLIINDGTIEDLYQKVEYLARDLEDL